MLKNLLKSIFSLKKKFNFLFIFLILFFSNSNLLSKEVPDWVKERPINNKYYIGIGFANKTKDSRDYITRAKQSALSDLASEVTINISSKVVDIIIEKSGVVKEDFERSIKSSTKEELEGYELIDVWESDKEYWVYYRLSKNKYKKIKQDKINKALNLALDLFRKAKKSEDKGKIRNALLFYFESLKSLEKYIGEPLKVEYKGSKVYLSNEIYSNIQKILNKIKLASDKKRISYKIVHPANGVLNFQVIYENGKSNNLSKLPFKFTFIKGAGELNNNINTDEEGNVNCTINKITSKEKIQTIKAELDITGFTEFDSTSVIYNNIMKSLPVPRINFTIEVKKIMAYINSNEYNLNKKVRLKILEPKLKKDLSDIFFNFANEPKKADISINIEANTRKGSELMGLYTAFADLTVSIIDLKSNNEIYKNSFNNINGVDLDYSKAGLKALRKAAKKICKELSIQINEYYFK